MHEGMPGTSKVTEVTIEQGLRGKIVSILCAKCINVTRHEVLQSLERKGSEECFEEHSSFTLGWSDAYQIVECRGCSSVSFLHEHWFSEADGSEEHIYPRRSLGTIATKDYLNAPFHLRRIYRETIEAFNFGSYTLCAAGLRTVVEAICEAKGIEEGSITKTKQDGTTTTYRSDKLEGKISGLSEKGILTLEQTRILHEHRFLGNYALHELTHPDPQELLKAIRIIEHVLDSLFEIPQTGQELRMQRQRREAAKRKP
ncbi:MAG: DUF4145 domain-containing protein [Gemmatales bacterium]